MHDTTIATKLPGQPKAFPGRISPHFSKPVARFIGDMMYGIMKEKDVKPSSVVRALKEGTSQKKVEDRLGFSLAEKRKSPLCPLFTGARESSCPGKWGISKRARPMGSTPVALPIPPLQGRVAKAGCLAYNVKHASRERRASHE